jgi:hypothetical protein
LSAQIAANNKIIAAQIAANNKIIAAFDKIIESQKIDLEARDAAAKRRSLRTLLALKEDQFQLLRAGNEFSHVKGKHKIATAIEKTFKIVEIDGEKMPLDSTSRILLNLMDQVMDQEACDRPWKFNQLRYNSEADVATYVKDILLDAIAILKLVHTANIVNLGDLAVFQERSSFSGRPDILAVRASTHRLPLLVVEVKKPVVNTDTEKLCDKQRGLGQAFDYGESHRASGHPLPVVVLTSLEESCVCWNSECTKATELYEGGVSTTAYPPTPQQKTKILATASASPPTLKSPDILHSVSRDESDELCFLPATERKLNRSTAFKAHELVHVLYTVLLHAAQATPTKQVQIHLLVPESTYTFPAALRFTTGAKDYTWGSLTVRVGKAIESKAHTSKKNSRIVKNKKPIDAHDGCAYYLIGRLGHGATSNVWHALDWKGNEVVIKMYVKTTNAEGHELDSVGFEAEAELATNKEVENFKSIYPFFEEKVYHMKLSDFHCVVMPFFKPVPKTDRSVALEKVRDVLTNSFKPIKLKYDDNDIRWSHVGTYVDHEQATRLILYDLADLVVTEDDDELFVKAHFDILKGRMGEQEAVGEQYECQQVSGHNEEASRKSASEREVPL